MYCIEIILSKIDKSSLAKTRSGTYQLDSPEVIVADVAGLDVEVRKAALVHVLERLQTRVGDEWQDVLPVGKNKYRWVPVTSKK